MRVTKVAPSSIIFAFFTASFFVLSFGWASHATDGCFGQSLVSRPVARLLTAPSEDPAYARHRALSIDVSLESTSTDVAGSASVSIDDANPIERSAFDKTNEVRAQSGLLPLLWSPELCRLARMHSEDMAQRGYFSHETPDGLRLRDRAKTVGILHFKLLAENIAYNQGYEDPGAFAVERWMLSAGHRANILYSGFQQSAIGVFVGVDGAVYLTQAFIVR